MLAFLALASATATPMQWDNEPYWQPVLNGRVISVNGNTVAQAIGGAEVGLQYWRAPLIGKGRRRRMGPPNLIGRSRVAATGTYGLTSNSIGWGTRLGSFIGPTNQVVTWQVGPDVWVNQYGSNRALDYWLPLGVGVDLHNTAIVRVAEGVNLQAGAIPGWTFTRSRQAGAVEIAGTPVFHELNAFAAVGLTIDNARLNVGVSRTWNAAGAQTGLILSGSIGL